MKRLILPFVFFSLIWSSTSSAQIDSLFVTPAKDYQCGYFLTLKNRNAGQQIIDQIKLEIVSADGTQWFPGVPPSQWTSPSQDDFTIVDFFATVPLAAGATKSGFLIEMDMTTSSSFPDKPVSVKWTTYNGSQVVSTGFMNLICTPFQYGDIDSVSVVPSVHNTDPCFTFTVFNKNANSYPISRFAVQLLTQGAGTMRPSKMLAPTGWVVDSVTATHAYFSTLTNQIPDDQSQGGFRVCLRGNPAVSNFSFVWFTYESGSAVMGRDTLRNISVTFTGSASEADSVSASVVDGCLYSMTVKNFHVSNTQLPSKIRQVAIWSKTPGLTFTAAPSAPVNWNKRLSVNKDSIIYFANHDSASLPSGRVSSEFRFQANPSSTDPFKVGWRTFRTLTEVLTTGEMQLQCFKEAPASDTATVEEVDECNWNIRITNAHNTPSASDLSAIDLSIPSGSGTLVTFGSSLGWTKTNETATSVRFVASAGEQQKTNTQQSILFAIQPTNPGQPVTLTWKSYDDAALQSGTPIKTATVDLTCTPVVVLCDLVSVVTESGGDVCMQNFTVQNKRTTALTGVTIEPRNGWKIDTATAPAGWDMQIDANKTLVNYSNSTGIAAEASLADFRVQFEAIDQSDTFGVKVSLADAAPRCDTTLTFICTSGTSGAVSEIPFLPEQVKIVPNPVKGIGATLELTLNEESKVHITILDILGHEVANISNMFMQAGTYSIPFTVEQLPVGTYYLRVQTAYGVVTSKIVRVK